MCSGNAESFIGPLERGSPVIFWFLRCFKNDRILCLMVVDALGALVQMKGRN